MPRKGASKRGTSYNHRSQSVTHTKRDWQAERHRAKRISAINAALNADPVDTQALRSFAMSRGGLMENGLRARVWPKLLGLDVYNAPDHTAFIHMHKDWDQVETDVKRSLFRFTPGEPKTYRKQKRRELARVVHSIASRNPDLHYYQGFHDVCSVFLLVAGESTAFLLAERVGHFHIRECMRPNMESVIRILSLLFPLLDLIDPDVHAFLLHSQVEPYFCLSWVLTWFSHRLDDFGRVVRLFDVFLASHPLTCLYFSAVCVVFMREGLLQQDCEYSAVHNFLHNLPQDLPVEDLIIRTTTILKKYPPDALQTYAKVDLGRSSPLNTYPNYPWLSVKLIPDHRLAKRKQLSASSSSISVSASASASASALSVSASSTSISAPIPPSSSSPPSLSSLIPVSMVVSVVSVVMSMWFSS